MKIPSKIVIKGKIWSVGYKWRLHDEKLGFCDGLADWVERTIWLDRSLPREEKLRVLLHEIIHIILDEYHMHETGGIKETFAEEVVCAGVSQTLLDIFNLKFREQHATAVARSRQRR
jgi:hypothetical protein